MELPGRYYRNYPVSNPLGHCEELFVLEPNRTVFLIVDVYGRGFGSEEPANDVPEMHQKWVRENRHVVADYIVPAKAAAKRAGLPVVYLTNHLSSALNEHTELRQVALRVDDVDLLHAWKEPSDVLYISQVIAPAAGDFLIRKQHYSGFFDTGLDSLLRSLNAYNLVAVGFESQICLGATVTEGMYRNYRVFVLRDAIATAEWVETAQERWANFLAVRYIETHVGLTCTTEQWIQACDRLG